LENKIKIPCAQGIQHSFGGQKIQFFRVDIGDGQVGVSPKGPNGFLDKMDMTISNNDEILLRWAFSITCLSFHSLLQSLCPTSSPFRGV
jgi:hypothetical protein